MNQKVDEENGRAMGKGNGQYRKFCRFSINESWRNIHCLVSAPNFGIEWSRLWEKEGDIEISRKKRKRLLILIKVDLYEVCLSKIIYCLLFYCMTIIIPLFCHICGISLTRVKEFRKYWPKVFELEEDKSTDEWQRGKLLINGFNETCKNISSSCLKVGDDSMSAIRFRTTEKGKLPHLSYIFPKPEPLGKEFKTVACNITGELLFIEFQKGKEGTKHSKYHQELVSTVACNKRMIESKKGIVHKYRKGATNDCFLFDSWFSSKKASGATMEVDAKLIGIVEKNTKGLCKNTI